jgi:hypothetical protein
MGRAAPGPYTVKVKCTAAVVKVLPPEGPKGECVGVVDEDFRGVHQPIAVIEPAVTELAVLCRGTEPERVKAAYGVEALYRQGQVVGGQEPSPVGIGIIVGVQVINE